MGLLPAAEPGPIPRNLTPSRPGLPVTDQAQIDIDRPGQTDCNLAPLVPNPPTEQETSIKIIESASRTLTFFPFSKAAKCSLGDS